MAERLVRHHWPMRAVYLGLILLLVFLHLLPLDTVPRAWAGPDLMLALTFVWVLRRPDFVPPLLIAAVFLLADFLFQRPPGLWAAIVLVACGTLRARAAVLRDQTFPLEWLSVATSLVAMTLGYRIILAILLIDQAPLGLSLMQLLATLAVYPFVVFLSQALLGVRKLAPGDIDTTGSRA